MKSVVEADPPRLEGPAAPVLAIPKSVIGSFPSYSTLNLPNPSTPALAPLLPAPFTAACPAPAKLASTSWSTWRKATTVPSARPRTTCVSPGATASEDTG